MDEGFFRTAFRSLTGHEPFSWQARLYKRLTHGDLPPYCNIPTGLGKTAVIPIWLIALAHHLHTGSVFPRRLIYIVNRRTIVDQATEIAESLRAQLRSDENARGLRQLLSEASSILHDEPVAISTLRGEFADNGEWKADPARPAIVIGTIDMIGSKLLFSGYGDGRHRRPHHAGLIGQDALIVHDEAHLSPAFSQLLRAAEAEQNRCGEKRPIRVMELSATGRGNVQDATNQGLGLDGNDRQDEVVQHRLSATKLLCIRDVEVDSKAKDALADRLAELAFGQDDTGYRVLIYARSPETAGNVADALLRNIGDGGERRLRLLTGTIRGHERDSLAKCDVFMAFKANPDRTLLDRTVYLVATSAGEVGVDLDADHLVCDLTMLDSMIQRFGRVNRLGGKGRTAGITIVCEKPEKAEGGEPRRKKGGGIDDLAARIAKTRELLERLPATDGCYDASPAALTELLRKNAKEAEDAFSPVPTIVPTTDILFDNWSLTSIVGDLPGRPEVAPYLHGIAEHEPPETFIAWRADVDYVAEEGLRSDDLADILDEYAIKPWERLRDSTGRVQKQLAALAKQERGEGEGKKLVGDMLAIVVDPAGRPVIATIRKAAEMNLAYHTVILPVEAGGLSKEGVFEPETKTPATDLDVADRGPGTSRARLRVVLRRGDAGWRAEYLAASGETAPALPTDAFDNAVALEDEVATATRMTIVQRIPIGGDDDEPNCILLYLVSPRDPDAPPTVSAEQQTLGKHTEGVQAAAQRIGKALRLDDSLHKALVLASQWHDAGKDRAIWQRYACNDNREAVLAKSPRYLHWKALGGYRHEFGSLHDAAADRGIVECGERDLVLHLIAAHHGWARPHFEPKHYDQPPITSDRNQAAAIEVMQRFARLQQRFGRWGLAWLESLLRCADGLASRGQDQSSQKNGGAE